jgi:hypothetical protein
MQRLPLERNNKVLSCSSPFRSTSCAQVLSGIQCHNYIQPVPPPSPTPPRIVQLTCSNNPSKQWAVIFLPRRAPIMYFESVEKGRKCRQLHALSRQVPTMRQSSAASNRGKMYASCQCSRPLPCRVQPMPWLSSRASQYAQRSRRARYTKIGAK